MFAVHPRRCCGSPGSSQTGISIGILRAGLPGALCAWLGFTAPPSLATAVFSQIPKKLWAINVGYDLVSYVLAGIILAYWHW